MTVPGKIFKKSRERSITGQTADLKPGPRSVKRAAMKLQNKIPLYVVAIVLLVGGAGAIAVLSIQRQASTDQFEQTAKALTSAISSTLQQDMLIGERSHIQDTLNSLNNRSSVAKVDILTTKNQIWASTNSTTIGFYGRADTKSLISSGTPMSMLSEPENGSLSVTEPIQVQSACLECHGRIAPAPNKQGLLGAIRVDVSTAVLDQSLARSRDVMIGLGALMFVLVAGAIVFLLRRLILKPLGSLISAASLISRGDYSTRVPVSNKKSELGAVSFAFNNMVNDMEEYTHQLQHANRELERANRMKSEFLANMSHELRTPLNVIIGFSEVLRDSPPDGITETDRQEFCENIISSGYDLLELINDVLDLSKVEAGQMQFSPEEFYIGPALSEIIATLQPLAARKEIKLEVTVSERLSSITSDFGKFKQIVYNLSGNAIKFTPAGGEVIVSATVLGSMARFAVADNGIGIAAADQERIFSEFQQVDGSASRQHEGTGLGLALTRRFVEMQGGHIWVESAPGEGSTFYFTLPLAEQTLPAATPADRLPDSDVAGNRPRSQPAAEPDVTRILVVEDDPKTAELIGLWLEQDGYDVEYAADGVEAVEKAKSIHPFAVCLDVMLPNQDGWQVLRQLKADPETADAGVIVCSAVDNPQMGFALGAADYCVKPLSRRPLLDKLRHLQVVTPLRRSRPQMLVADSDPSAAAETAAILERQGFAVIKAGTGEEAWEMALENLPDIIIMDQRISGTGFFDVVSMLRQHPITVDIPVILTASSDAAIAENNLLDIGAVRRVIRKEGGIRQELLDEVFRLERFQPERARLVDVETGLFNRRYFQKRLTQEVRRAIRYSLDLSVLLVSIDGGETSGVDQASLAKSLAGLLAANVRAADQPARYDDRRFAVILPETAGGDAVKVAQKLVDLVSKTKFLSDVGAGFRFTISAAVADCPRGAFTAEQIVEKLESGIESIVKQGGNQSRLV